jgi:predicted nucleic-acid-binding protein
MIGLDTNVVIRYLAQDDARQAAAATHLIEELTPDSPRFLASVVLAEIVWVMEELYGSSREQVSAIVERLLQTRSLVVQDAEVAWRALSRYRKASADFADYLIERTGVAFGCEAIYTFDKKAARTQDCGMTLVR